MSPGPLPSRPEKVSWREGSGPKMGRRHPGRGITLSKGPGTEGLPGSQVQVASGEKGCVWGPDLVGPGSQVEPRRRIHGL